ncbi:hypothetical protein AQUCO_00901080v1 [Aquilegia coerulea]|uniref:PHD-type domain-containing protein n=1 Tax=Aquilegia coerulea TaxID=218851 RepID=A0A2G5EGM4_AQUCA|nr:hypothetical protein AQUCO_00901080v1 [Aquilegia coerulea]
MAHGTDSEEFRLVSGARSGLKREFAFALKNQSDLSGSMGRTRRRVQNSPCVDVGSEFHYGKRLKSDDEKEEGGIDLVVKENDQNDSLEIESVEKLKEDGSKATCMEESKLDSFKCTVDEELETNLVESVDNGEPKTDLVESIVTEEPKNDLVESVMEDEGENNLDKIICNTEGEVKMENPVVIDNNVEAISVVGKPLRRFTRSALKPKAEPVEVEYVATSSGSTVLSEEGGKVSTEKDKGTTSDADSSLKTPLKSMLEMKTSKKIALGKLPSSVRDLLDTGLLEGLPVKYLFRNKKNEGLKGTIKNFGILCSCSTCKGCQVVTPYQFEKHAQSNNKHPSDNIYLENGKNLHEVLNACKNAPLETLEHIIKAAISSSPEAKHSFCNNCKEPLAASRSSKTIPFCESCLASDKSLGFPSRVIVSGDRSSNSVSTPKSSATASECGSSQTKSKGKLTKKDLGLHKLVFEEQGLPDGTALSYFICGQKRLEGYKKGHNIFCYHCQEEISPSQFESHAGYASRRKPYLNIYTSNGVSLHELSISLSKSRKVSNHKNDDLCTYCFEFGDLLCCDMCPRAFHQDCLGLSDAPQCKWYCPYCITMYEREKSCEYNANAKAAGRVSGVDPIEQITRRCIRIVETSESEIGGCVLCRHHSFSTSGFGPSTVILCDQCEKEYHVGCLKDHKMADLKELPEGNWFCSGKCSWIHTAMKKLVKHGYENLPDSILKVIKKKQEEAYPNDGADVRWRVLSGKTDCGESKSLLSTAVTIFHGHFDPIVDAKTGHDLIPSMVYGRNMGDQDFGGMYCAVLVVNSVVVSAAIFRIFGVDIVEIPLVATASDYQGRGYFHSLFSCMERLLAFLGVKTIVLPSAAESKGIWTQKFGFSDISQDQLIKYRDRCQMMVFQGTSMLHKPVPPCRKVGKSSGAN